MTEPITTQPSPVRACPVCGRSLREVEFVLSGDELVCPPCAAEDDEA